MDTATLWNWVLTIITGAISFLLTKLWSTIDMLRYDITKLENYQASIEPQLAETRRQFDRIEKQLEEILKDLKSKQDKP